MVIFSDFSGSILDDGILRGTLSDTERLRVVVDGRRVDVVVALVVAAVVVVVDVVLLVALVVGHAVVVVLAIVALRCRWGNTTNLLWKFSSFFVRFCSIKMCRLRSSMFGD